MRNSFSPKQVARAFDVSESSLKRWCDRGLIPMVRTAGGHRRIALADIVNFVRTSNQVLVRPQLLGLPTISGPGDRALTRARDHVLRALTLGDEAACRRLVIELYVAGHRMCELCDEVLAFVMARVGDLWQCGDVEVYQERLGCEICSRILDDCRDYVPDSACDAPLAIGATPSGDPYTLPTRMAELVLKESGWRSISLGIDLPFETLAVAVADKRPRAVWLSVSSIADADEFLAGYHSFQEQLDPSVALVVGGRALTDVVRRQMKFFAYCENFQQLGDMARTLAAHSQVADPAFSSLEHRSR